MTDSSPENNLPSSKISSDSGVDSTGAKRAVVDEEGPGIVSVELSWTKSLIRDLESDNTICRDERNSLRLYYTHKREKLQLKLRVFAEAEKIKELESAIQPKERNGLASAEESLAEAQVELIRATSALSR